MLANLKLTDSHRDRGPGLCLSLSSRVRAEFYKLRQTGKSAVPTGSGPGLSLQAACRMCVVRIEKMPKLQTACLERRPQRALAFQPLQQSSRGVCKSELKEQCWAALGGKGAVQESVASPALQQSRGEA